MSALYIKWTKSSFETCSGHEILRRSDLEQPQLPETRSKIDFDRSFGSMSVSFLYKIAMYVPPVTFILGYGSTGGYYQLEAVITHPFRPP